MKYLVRNKTDNVILDSFNDKKEAEKYKSACEAVDAVTGEKNEYDIILRIGDYA